MKSVTHVGAVIDTRQPAEWVINLLQRLSENSQLTLTVALVESDTHTQTDSTKHDTALEKLASQVSRWILFSVIDRPQFDYNPWSPAELPSDLPVSDLDTSPDALSPCNVVVDLCTGSISTMVLALWQVPTWSAQVQSLHKRVESNLLRNAPMMWLHLWDLKLIQSGDNPDTGRVSSHSLPNQTFSISDLQRLSYASLPSLYESRLIWFANNQKLMSDIEIQENALGVFEQDRIDAACDARRWFTSSTRQSASREALVSAILAVRLLIQQCIVRLKTCFFEETWQLAVHRNTSDAGLADTSDAPIDYVGKTAIADYKDLAITRDLIWADPHVQTYLDDHYVFFEKMHRPNQHAHLAVAKLDKSGELGEPRTVLAENIHLSYPHVFESQGEHYMIPETVGTRNIRLYKADAFPFRWDLAANLVEGIDAADTTLFYHESRWWMFTNCLSHRSVDERDVLHLYFSDDLMGPWQAHPMNPVITGVDRSRMAGAIFTSAGQHYRFSQYGAYRYGYGINISKIENLSRTDYRETALHRLIPAKDSPWIGCHSLSFANEFTIIDRLRVRYKFRGRAP